MSRRFWAGVMTVSVLVACGAGYFLWSQLMKGESVSVPLEQVAAVPAPEAPASPTPTPSVEPTPAAESSTETAETTTAASATSTGPTRNISFSLHSKNAKEVFVVGDFTKWMRKPMTKDKNWRVTLPLAPGKYEYMFVVDGKRIRDPNAKSVSAEGHSVVDVKPLKSQR